MHVPPALGYEYILWDENENICRNLWFVYRFLNTYTIYVYYLIDAAAAENRLDAQIIRIYAQYIIHNTILYV